MLTETNERIFSYLQESDTGVSSLDIAETFFKFTLPNEEIARTTISKILQKDNRFLLDSDNLWRCNKSIDKKELNSLGNSDWLSCYVLTAPVNGIEKVCHVSVWTVSDTPECEESLWFIEPQLIEDPSIKGLISSFDKCTDRAETIQLLVEKLRMAPVVFLTSRQQRIVQALCQENFETIHDFTMLISQLGKVALERAIPVQSIESAWADTHQSQPFSLNSAADYGCKLSEVAQTLRHELIRQDIKTEGEFERQLIEKTCLPKWTNAQFTLEDVISYPESPGIYTFKDVSNKILYIGKAKNLRYRLFTYFYDSNESPRKLAQLREEAFSLDIHHCGSELESLLLEYKLIKKYDPPLNTQRRVNSRKGDYEPLEDCIVLLRSADESKGMSMWIKNNNTVLLKQFDVNFDDKEILTGNIHEYFFENRLTEGKNSPDEYFSEEFEITYRWITKNRDLLHRIDIKRYVDAEEVMEAVETAWKDTH